MKKVNWRDEEQTDGRRNERIARAHGTSFIHEHWTIKMFCEKSLTQCACLFFAEFLPIANIFLLLLLPLLVPYRSNDDGSDDSILPLAIFPTHLRYFIYILFPSQKFHFRRRKIPAKKASAHWFEWQSERGWVTREDTLMAYNDESMNCREMCWSLAQWRNSFYTGNKERRKEMNKKK